MSLDPGCKAGYVAKDRLNDLRVRLVSSRAFRPDRVGVPSQPYLLTFPPRGEVSKVRDAADSRSLSLLPLDLVKPTPSINPFKTLTLGWRVSRQR